MLTGVKDLDFKILNKLEDQDLVSVCKTNKQANKLCDDQNFWLQRIMIKFPYLSLSILKKYKGNVNFYVFNKDLSQCWRINGAQLTEQSLAVANGFNILHGEKFFHVPYKEAELIGGN